LQNDEGSGNAFNAVDGIFNNLNNPNNAVAVEGQYISALTYKDNILTAERKDLPTYTLSTGTTNGTVSFNG
jgi:hypothetical protein